MQGISSAELKQLRSVFNLFDDQGTGAVSAALLKSTLLHAAQKHPDDAGDPKQYYSTVMALEKLRDKNINFNEFAEIFAATSAATQRDDTGRITKEEAFRLFRLVDVDNKGRIGYLELKSLMEDIGEIVAPEELQEMLYRADLNGDGYIDPDEFYSVVACRHTFAENS